MVAAAVVVDVVASWRTTTIADSKCGTDDSSESTCGQVVIVAVVHLQEVDGWSSPSPWLVRLR